MKVSSQSSEAGISYSDPDDIRFQLCCSGTSRLKASASHTLYDQDTVAFLKGGNSHDIPTFVFPLSGDKPAHAPVLYLQPQGAAFPAQPGIIKLSEFTFGNDGLLNGSFT